MKLALTLIASSPGKVEVWKPSMSFWVNYWGIIEHEWDINGIFMGYNKGNGKETNGIQVMEMDIH